jgi:Flp pilus assembly pilin Flp
MNQLLARVSYAFYSLRSREEGQAMVEYALILLLVSLAAVALLSALGGYPASIFNKVNDDLGLH